MTTATRPKRAKPKSPEMIMAERAAARMQDFAAVGMQSTAALLATNDDVEVRRQNQEHIETARRLDAFDALKEGMETGAYDCARRLERDMLIRRGLGDHGRGLDRVDNGRSSAELARIQRIIAAAEAVERVLSRVSDRDRWLLTWLIEPPLGRFNHWREVVHHISGETNPNAQGAVVRYACGSLRDAYDVADRAAS